MPARLRDLIRIARSKYGITTLPAHNGERTMLSDEYLRGFCRAFGLDFDELRSLL